MSLEKDWQDEPHLLEVLQGLREPTSTTPLDAEAMEDLEARIRAALGGIEPSGEEAVNVVPAAGAAQTLPAYSTPISDYTLSATKLALTMPTVPPTGDKAVTIFVFTRQDATGERAVELKGSVIYPSGIEIADLLTKTPNSVDLWSLTWSPVDAAWIASMIAADLSGEGEEAPATATVVRETKTYPITDAVGVASGATNYLPPMYVSIPRSGSGEKLKLIGAWAVIRGGTKAKIKIQRNGSDVTGLTGIEATTSLVKKTLETALELSDGDSIAVVVESVEGSPDNASITFLFDRTLP